MSEHTPTAAYFDYEKYFDVEPFDAGESAKSNKHLSSLLSALAILMGCEARSICESCGVVVDKEGKKQYKLSYHIVYPVKCQRPDLKKLVNMAVTQTACKGLDNKPYNRRQAWRLVGMAKKEDKNRVKKIIYGTYEDSIVTNVEGLDDFVMPAPKSVIRSVDPNTAISVPRSLLWVHYILQDFRLKTLWQNKSEDYGTWMEFIWAVLAECSSESHYDFGKSLVLQFSAMSSKFVESEVIAKFEQCVGQAVTSKGIKTLKRWITTSGKYKDAYKESLHVLEEEESDPISNETLQLIDNILAPVEFFPLTSMHWLLQNLTLTGELSMVLQTVKQSKGQKNVCDVLSLYSLVRYMTPEEDVASQRIISGMQRAADLANLKDPVYIPYKTTLMELTSNHHHRACLSYLLDCLTIAETEDLEAKLAAADKKPVDAEFVSQFFRVLFKHDGWLAKYKSVRDSALYPLSPEETVNVYERIVHIRDTELQYTLQLPYKNIIMEMWSIAHYFETSFRITLMYACCEAFRFEQYLPLLCCAYNDMTAAVAILSLFPYVYSVGETCYCYCPDSGRWLDTSDADYGPLKRICMRFSTLLQHHSREKNRHNFATSAGGVTAISKIIGHLRGGITDYDNAQANSSRGRLLFPNGIYDGNTRTFLPTWDICIPCFKIAVSVFVWPECYFHASIPDDYISREDVVGDALSLQWYEEIDKVLFTQMNGDEVAKFLKEELGKTLLRIEAFKGFWIVIGNPNSGKSTLKNMIEVSVGDYAGTASLAELELVKFDRRDVGLRNQFAYNNWYRSFLFFSEISEGVLSTELIKSHSSGMSDRVPTRTQYKKTILVDPQYVMWIMCNDVPTVSKPDDPAYIDRAKYMRYDKVYKPVSEITDPTSELPAMPEVKQWKTMKLRRQLFVRLLLDSFEDFSVRGVSLPVPESVKQATRDSAAVSTDNDAVMDQLMYLILMTGDERDVITEEHFRKLCEENRIRPETAKKCLTIALDNIYKSNSQIFGRPVNIERVSRKGQKINVWRGMTLRNEMDMSEIHAFTSFAQWKMVFVKYNGRIPKLVVSQMEEIGKALANNRDYELDDEDIELFLPVATPVQRLRIEELIKKREEAGDAKRQRVN